MEVRVRVTMSREGDIGRDSRLGRKDDWREEDVNNRDKTNHNQIEKNSNVNQIKNKNKVEFIYRENLTLLNNRNSSFIYREINSNSSRTSDNRENRKLDIKLDIKIKENLLEKQVGYENNNNNSNNNKNNNNNNYNDNTKNRIEVKKMRKDS